jgi:cation/acetate symporter
MADLLAYRLNARPVRAVASLSTLTVSTMYMIAQMVGAGALVGLLLPGVPYEMAVICVGVLMVVYVVFGGMLATTWVQIIKAVLLVGGSIFLSLLVMQHFNFSLAAFFEAIATVPVRAANGEVMAKNFLTPGMKFHGALGAIDLLSLGVALICGTAALPHILVRFYTVPDAKTARVSVVWAMFIIGAFYIMTTFLGFGAATILTPEKLVWAGKAAPNMAAPLLASHLGGPIFFAFICAVAFATILAVVAGLTISASTSFAHDFFSNVLFVNDKPTPDAEVRVARVMAFIVAAISIWIAIILGPTVNVAFLVGLAFAVAASANLPVIVFTVFWKHLTTAGACAGQITGLVSSVLLVMLSKTGMGAHAIFPLENPGIVSIPLGFLVTWLVSLATREPAAEAKFGELQVRATTGLGAEKAGGH